MADVNGDGKLDVVATTWASDSNQFFVLLGNGDGTFGEPIAFTVGVCPLGTAFGDFNKDGMLDIVVADQCGGPLSVMLGAVPSPAVTLSPTSLSFGTQLFGTLSNPQYVTLSNTGGTPLDITSISASSNFSQTNNCGSSVAVGASCTLSVIFRPYKVGAITGTITITDNASNSPQTVSLTGTSTVVTLLPSSLSFGNQPVGTTSQPQTVTFTNYAKHASLNIASVRFTGSNLSSFAQTNTCGTSVPAGGSCTISVTFTPTHKGQKSATLEVFDNGGASPQTVALSGTGT